MGKFDGVLLASDMDGTLLDSGHEISRENAEAVRYFTDNGGLFTIASGRMIPAIELYTRQLSINAPVIALNGAAVYDIKSSALLRSRPHDANIAEIVEGLAGAFPELGVEVVMLDRMYICRGSEVSRVHCEIIRVPYVLTDVRDVAAASAGGGRMEQSLQDKLVNHKAASAGGGRIKQCMKLNLTQAPEYLDGVERYMSASYPGAFCVVHSDPHYLEVLHIDANKGWGLDAVADIMKVSRGHVYAAGDNYNDIELLKRAAVAFAPANAEPQVKESADVVVSSNDEHAIRDVIAHLDARYG